MLLLSIILYSIYMLANQIYYSYQEILLFKRKNFFEIILKLDFIRDILFLVLTRKQRFEKLKVKKLLTLKWAM
ncbi:Uncharacterised protein [Mycobacteroides abscessus subsp. abscessus]|nr:Uncharacterised protein [Mycobacteroides abscessus subsp. abscessus]